MKYLIFLFTGFVLVLACSSPQKPPVTSSPDTNSKPTVEPKKESGSSDKGIGKFTHVEISAQLDGPMATEGQKLYDVKCAACHRLDEKRVVGPGWKDVTKRRTPEWIMNFSTNTDEMLSKDPASQAMLEICLVRMPNQNLSDEDARKILEFMRKNDGIK
jgi:cytochrome c551/c552